MNGGTLNMQYEHKQWAIHAVQVYTRQRRRIIWSQVEFMKNEASFNEQRLQATSNGMLFTLRWLQMHEIWLKNINLGFIVFIKYILRGIQRVVTLIINDHYQP